MPLPELTAPISAYSGTAQQSKFLLIFIKEIVLAAFPEGVSRDANELSEKRVGSFRS